jgi:hypothetical protein
MGQTKKLTRKFQIWSASIYTSVWGYSLKFNGEGNGAILREVKSKSNSEKKEVIPC